MLALQTRVLDGSNKHQDVSQVPEPLQHNVPRPVDIAIQNNTARRGTPYPKNADPEEKEAPTASSRLLALQQLQFGPNWSVLP